MQENLLFSKPICVIRKSGGWGKEHLLCRGV
jgi:hypothetical protein